MAVNTLQVIGGKIFILGTNHIAQASKETVHRVITQIHPGVVMIELDDERLQILQEREAKKHQNTVVDGTANSEVISESESQTIPVDDPPNISPFLSAFEHIQQSMGGIMGIMPGDEFLTAVKVVKDLNIPLFMIDLPIYETIERITRLQMQSPEEQNHLMEELNMDNLPDDQDKIRDFFRVLENPDEVKALLAEFRTQFPELTKILVDDRNDFMVNKIKDYHSIHPSKKILVVCGALHVPGILSSLQSILPSESKSKE
ncbi:MAG: TraB domain-containing protein [Promethearchaeota archaeon]